MTYQFNFIRLNIPLDIPLTKTVFLRGLALNITAWSLGTSNPWPPLTRE